MVVLDELDVAADRGIEGLLAKGLEEEAPGVAEHLRLEDDDAVDIGGNGLHRRDCPASPLDEGARGLLAPASFTGAPPTIWACSRR